MDNIREKELSFMFEIEKWMVAEDLQDEIHSFENINSYNLDSYLNEIKGFVSWKAPDLMVELNNRINDFKNNKKETNSRIYNEQENEEELENEF